MAFWNYSRFWDSVYEGLHESIYIKNIFLYANKLKWYSILNTPNGKTIENIIFLYDWIPAIFFSIFQQREISHDLFNIKLNEITSSNLQYK